VLGREDGAFKGSAAFFDAVSQDPVLNRVKLIAEPWDIGSYDVGNFPVDWSEWNGRFRDTMRKFVKGDAGQLRDLGWRLTGSADLYSDDGRSAYNSINFVTCHDGFTLHDLVTYNGKHNEANLEQNRDGTYDNNSWNTGVEGPTDNAAILQLRKQLAKNHICALFLSNGTPMMLGGDEFLRTQNGKIMPIAKTMPSVGSIGVVSRPTATCMTSSRRSSLSPSATRYCNGASSSSMGIWTPITCLISPGSAPI
jgi:glycogen operon protein